MKISTKDRRITFLITFFFVFTNLIPTGFSQYQYDLTLLQEAPSPRFEINLPPELGKVEEYFMPRTAYRTPRLNADHGVRVEPFIFHIQTAHGDIGIQKKVKDILRYLHETHKISLAFAEGASEKLNPELLRFFDDPLLNQKMTDRLLRKGLYTGVDLFLVDENEQRKSRVEVLGIEQMNSYRAAYESFKKVLRSPKTVKSILAPLELELDRSASQILSKDEILLLKNWQRFQKREISFSAYINLILEAARTELKLDFKDPFLQLEWPVLVRIAHLQEFQKNLDKEKLQKEKEKLVVSLRGSVGDGAISWMASTLSGTPSLNDEAEGDPRRFFEHFLEKAFRKGFRFEDYPNFTRWMATLILRHELEGRAISEELDKLWDKIKGQMKDEKAQEIIRRYEELVLLKKFLNLELTRREWEKLKGDQENNLWQMVCNGECSLHCRHAPSAISHTLSSARRFYRLAERRESIFFKRLIQQMKFRGADKAILVTGGFHTSGLTRLFKEKGLGYVVISPRIEGEISHDFYREVMLGDHLERTSLALRPETRLLQQGEKTFRSETRMVQETFEEIHPSENWKAATFSQLRSRAEVRMEISPEAKVILVPIGLGAACVTFRIIQSIPVWREQKREVRQILQHFETEAARRKNRLETLDDVRRKVFKRYRNNFQLMYQRKLALGLARIQKRHTGQWPSGVFRPLWQLPLWPLLHLMERRSALNQKKERKEEVSPPQAEDALPPVLGVREEVEKPPLPEPTPEDRMKQALKNFERFLKSQLNSLAGEAVRKQKPVKVRSFLLQLESKFKEALDRNLELGKFSGKEAELFRTQALERVEPLIQRARERISRRIKELVQEKIPDFESQLEAGAAQGISEAKDRVKQPPYPAFPVSTVVDNFLRKVEIQIESLRKDQGFGEEDLAEFYSFREAKGEALRRELQAYSDLVESARAKAKEILKVKEAALGEARKAREKETIQTAILPFIEIISSDLQEASREAIAYFEKNANKRKPESVETVGKESLTRFETQVQSLLEILQTDLQNVLLDILKKADEARTRFETEADTALSLFADQEDPALTLVQSAVTQSRPEIQEEFKALLPQVQTLADEILQDQIKASRNQIEVVIQAARKAAIREAMPDYQKKALEIQEKAKSVFKEEWQKKENRLIQELVNAVAKNLEIRPDVLRKVARHLESMKNKGAGLFGLYSAVDDLLSLYAKRAEMRLPTGRQGGDQPLAKDSRREMRLAWSGKVTRTESPTAGIRSPTPVSRASTRSIRSERPRISFAMTDISLRNDSISVPTLVAENIRSSLRGPLAIVSSPKKGTLPQQEEFVNIKNKYSEFTYRAKGERIFNDSKVREEVGRFQGGKIQAGTAFELGRVIGAFNPRYSREVLLAMLRALRVVKYQISEEITPLYLREIMDSFRAKGIALDRCKKGIGAEILMYDHVPTDSEMAALVFSIALNSTGGIPAEVIIFSKEALSAGELERLGQYEARLKGIKDIEGNPLEVNFFHHNQPRVIANHLRKISSQLVAKLAPQVAEQYGQTSIENRQLVRNHIIVTLDQEFARRLEMEDPLLLYPLYGMKQVHYETPKSSSYYSALQSAAVSLAQKDYEALRELDRLILERRTPFLYASRYDRLPENWHSAWILAEVRINEMLRQAV